MNYIDKVYYINLDHRKDRLAQIEQVLDELECPVAKRERIPGIYTPEFGTIGCAKSHMLAVEKFIKSELQTCIIFEDDFIYTNKEQFDTSINNIFTMNIDFDIIQLSYNDNDQTPQDTTWPFLKTFQRAGCISGILLHKNFAPKLLQNYKDGQNLLQDHIKTYNCLTHHYHIDVYWNLLVSHSKWYWFYPKLGKQRPSYSDIENRHTDYGV